jgi:3-phenylpropionate/trans-cinnamate dioxygenase ferredoxin reductase subunit
VLREPFALPLHNFASSKGRKSRTLLWKGDPLGGADRRERAVGKGVIIIGGGHGGSQLAASLRSEGYTDPVTLVTAESDIPYQRPPLSKTYLKEPERGLQELRPQAFYDDHKVDLRLSTKVVAIDPAKKTVLLDNGETLEWEHLVLATGARPRIPNIPGTDLNGVFYLRDAADVRGMHERFKAAESVVVIGGGFIGLELAATARQLGRNVTVIEATGRLMGRAVATEISDHFLRLHRGWGTTVLLNAGAKALIGRNGEVVAVSTGDDTPPIPADLVVIGIGVIPNVELAQQVGIVCDNGIVVGSDLRTSNPDIFAIGDCAAFVEPSVGRRMRIESVQNAVDQAKHVAKTITGKGGTPYHAVPWFWSDQQDAKLQMVGLAEKATRRVIRGKPEEGAFSVFQFDGDRLVNIDSVNKPGDHMLGRRVMEPGGRMPTPEQAADEGFDLKQLLRKPAA